MAPTSTKRLGLGISFLNNRLEPRSSSWASSPFAAYDLSRRQEPAAKDDTEWHRGSGAVSPDAFNNKAIFVLFGLLGLGLVLSSIWFFFWARDGGFRFKEGDWEEYKSTVLRRKGKDGKTLSNATPRTELLGSETTDRTGDDSVRGDYDHDDAPHQFVRSGQRDDDVRRYRHEKPARVGGLNRKADGSYWDPTNSERSELSSATPQMREHPQGSAAVTAAVMTSKEKKKKEKEERAKGKAKAGRGFLGRHRHADDSHTDAGPSAGPSAGGKGLGTKRQPRQPSAAYSFVEGDDSTVSGDTSYLNEQRRRRQSENRRAQRSSNNYEYHRGASSSPTKKERHYRDKDNDNETYVSDPTTTTTGGGGSGPRSYGDASSVSGVAETDTGTKIYPHYIAGVSRSGPPTDPSIFRVPGTFRAGDSAAGGEGAGAGRAAGGKRSPGPSSSASRVRPSRETGGRRGAAASSSRRRNSLSDSGDDMLRR